jgi:tellurite resistance protein
MIAQGLGAVALAFALLAGVQTWRIKGLQLAHAEQQAQLEKDRSEAIEKARAAEQLMADGARKAAGIYAQQINKVRTDADGARGELERLRDALGTPSDAAQDAAAAAGADDASRARIVVGRCAATLQAMAAAADTCESRLTGLQEWAKAVTQ